MANTSKPEDFLLVNDAVAFSRDKEDKADKADEAVK
jgi:hypothetical protein